MHLPDQRLHTTCLRPCQSFLAKDTILSTTARVGVATVFPWPLAGVESSYCLKVTCLVKLLSCTWLERVDFLGDLLILPLSSDVLCCQCLQFQVWGIRGRNTSQGAYYCVVLWVPRFLSGPSFYLSESYVFFMCNIRIFSGT